MNKENFILSIKIENDNYSKNIILDKFDTFKNCNKWAKWLEEIYKKVKEKK